MKKRILALGLALTMVMPMTAMAEQKVYQSGEKFTTQTVRYGATPRQVDIVSVDDLAGSSQYTTEQFISCIKTGVARQFPDCDIYAVYSSGYVEIGIGSLWVDGYQLTGKVTTAEDLGFVSVFPDGTIGEPGAYTGEGVAVGGAFQHYAVTTPSGRSENCFRYACGVDAGGMCEIYILPKDASDIHIEFCDEDRDNWWVSFGHTFFHDKPNTGGAVYLKGGPSQTALSQSQTTQTWVSDASGWRVQNADGSYLTNQWFQSNGLWYYLGTDGYMLTNTTTPDGYRVNGDGVWVQ